MAQKIGDLLTADGVRLADVEFPLWRVDDKSVNGRSWLMRYVCVETPAETRRRTPTP